MKSKTELVAEEILAMLQKDNISNAISLSWSIAQHLEDKGWLNMPINEIKAMIWSAGYNSGLARANEKDNPYGGIHE